MTKADYARRPARAMIALVLGLAATPLWAQSAPDTAEARLRKLEAEVSALQRTVFPGGSGKYFAPLVPQTTPAPAATGTPASTPVTDLLARMDAVEGQLARLTAQGEETANRMSQFEARLAALTPPAPPPAAAVVGPPADAPAVGTPVAGSAASTNGAVTTGNLAAMTAAGTGARPGAGAPAAAKPAPAAKPPAGKAAAGKAAAPSPQRVAAVKAIEKPATDDPGDDEYSYGFRLWEAKFYPEAEQQLKLYLHKYPKHARVSFARNLLGRAYLDDGDPREAASWFLQNYQAAKTGERAPDSLLYLAEAMRQLKDTSRACVALAQFADDYPREAAGRLKAQYDAARTGIKCN